MAPGDTTQGKRRYSIEGIRPWQLQPGEYMLAGDGSAWVRLPNGNGPSHLRGWDSVEHEDGTITVSPSILAQQRSAVDDEGNPVSYAAWHGYLERGVWREVR